MFMNKAEALAVFTIAGVTAYEYKLCNTKSFILQKVKFSRVFIIRCVWINQITQNSSFLTCRFAMTVVAMLCIWGKWPQQVLWSNAIFLDHLHHTKDTRPKTIDVNAVFSFGWDQPQSLLYNGHSGVFWAVSYVVYWQHRCSVMCLHNYIMQIHQSH